MNSLQRIRELGQSIWLDDIHRGLLTSGELAGLIEKDGLGGLTSNPTIFQKAILDHDDYAAALAGTRALAPQQRFERLAVEDVQGAADLLQPVFKATDGHDGFACFEVSPEHAHDTAATVREVLRLREWLARDNVMIKVPATDAGLLAFEQLISLGININVTLLFSIERYELIAAAHQRALLHRLDQGLPVKGIASVASFFMSRIDTLVDKRIDALSDGPARQQAHAMRGGTAIALAELALAGWRRRMESEDWQRLRAAGAQPQRLLWASTSAKDPSFPDTKYVDALIAPDTVNTVPMATLKAYRDHGDPVVRLGHADPEAVRQRLAGLEEAGIDLGEVARQLEDEGQRKFADSYGALMNALAGDTAGIRSARA